MKYRKLFYLTLPFSVFGLGKIIKHHHHGCGGNFHHNKRKYMMKYFAWRLGLSEEQKEKIHNLFKGLKEEGKPFTDRHKNMRNVLTKEFRKENFETDMLQELCTPEVVGQGHELLMKGLKEIHDILTPVQREKMAAHFERCHCC